MDTHAHRRLTTAAVCCATHVDAKLEAAQLRKVREVWPDFRPVEIAGAAGAGVIRARTARR